VKVQFDVSQHDIILLLCKEGETRFLQCIRAHRNIESECGTAGHAG